MSITELTAGALSDALRRRELSASEVTDAYLRAAEVTEPTVGAYLTVCAEQARAQARAVDRARMRGEALPPFAGVPIAVKDNICTEGVRTTCASRMLEHFVPPYSATVWEKLLGGGSILLGKVNMDEFAMGSSTEHSALGVTRNPRDPRRVAGGSSGGSAAAVCARSAPWALGTDAGGSIRQPASFCGVVGMRPTYGTVSRRGLISFAPSFDQIGPLTRCVRDNALLLGLIAGHDPLDAQSVCTQTPDYTSMLGADLHGLRVGILQVPDALHADPDVSAAAEGALTRLAALGAQTDAAVLAGLQYALSAYHIIADAEASSNLARFDGIRFGHRTKDGSDPRTVYARSRSEGFGTEVKRRILIGAYLLQAGEGKSVYETAQCARRRIRAEYEALFRRFDLIASPVCPTTAHLAGEKLTDPLSMYFSDLYTVAPSIAGLPALSLPCGTDRHGMPVGLQLVAPPLGEPLLYAVGDALEQVITEK